MNKDDSILVFLRELSAQGIDWQLKDHWQGDRHAIGLTSADMPEHLAYVSSLQQPPGEYYVELEVLALGATVETTISDPYPLAEALTFVRNHLDSSHDPRWPGRRPFWDPDSAAESKLIRRLLQRRFPDLYQRLTSALEQADPYGVVHPNNPDEYNDVIHEFLVMTDPVDGDLTRLSHAQADPGTAEHPVHPARVKRRCLTLNDGRDVLEQGFQEVVQIGCDNPDVALKDSLLNEPFADMQDGTSRVDREVRATAIRTDKHRPVYLRPDQYRRRVALLKAFDNAGSGSDEVAVPNIGPDNLIND